MIRPSLIDDVFIPCNAFSANGMAGWTEGALEMVELVLRYFDLDD